MKAKKSSRAEKVRQYIKANPNASVADMAKHFNTTYQVVYMIKRNMEGKAVKKPKPTPAQKLKFVQAITTSKNLNEMIAEAEGARKEMAIQMIEPTPDPVNHPAHYKVGGIETIDFIEAKGLTYNLGNVIKYITRAEHKGNKHEDLCKARWYLNREIAKHTSATT